VGRATIWGPVLVAVALRGYAIWAPYPGPELQEAYVGGAVLAVVRGDWAPPILIHGAALFDLLRGLATLWYAIGYTLSLYGDRVDFLAAYVRHPEPFVVTGRVVVSVLGVAAVYLVGRVGRDRFGVGTGALAALLLATSSIHVRECFNVWPDGPAATAAVAGMATALWALRVPGFCPLALAGACAGLSIATKHSMAPVAMAVVAAVCLRPDTSTAIARGLVVAGLATVATYLVLSPYTVRHAAELRRNLGIQLGAALATGGGAKSSWATLVPVTLGWLPCAAAAAGLVAAIHRDARTAVVMAIFPLAYAAVLVRAGGLLYARYFAALAPFVALFAAAGIVALASLVARRHATAVALFLTAIVASPSAWNAVQYVHLRARDDTRRLAGAWILANVPVGTPLAFPDILGHANPVLPPNPATLAREFPTFARTLMARGGLDGRTYPTQYLAIAGLPRTTLPTANLVVTATLPIELPGLTVPEVVERLQEAGARPVATFESTRLPPPPRHCLRSARRRLPASCRRRAPATARTEPHRVDTSAARLGSLTIGTRVSTLWFRAHTTRGGDIDTACAAFAGAPR
jgi:hypothetical protein